MSYNEALADRIREALVDHPKVEEKKMFRGVTFMVDGKMCICVSGDELLCRVGPSAYEEAISKDHTREMGKGAKVLKGYLYVSEEGFKTKKQFDHWVKLCLDFNKDAKASKKAKKK